MIQLIHTNLLEHWGGWRKEQTETKRISRRASKEARVSFQIIGEKRHCLLNLLKFPNEQRTSTLDRTRSLFFILIGRVLFILMISKVPKI